MKNFANSDTTTREDCSKKKNASSVSGNANLIMRLIHGAIIGLGAVLPGVSGGVLCVVFGVYKPIMELLSHPFRAVRKYTRLLIPIVIGFVFGFLGISKLLGVLLEAYPDPSVCFFAGLILGMLPSLFREAGKEGRGKGSFVSLGLAFAVALALLLGLNTISFSVRPGFAWYLFCGFCIALSIIAPGMSFSTLLMPLGLYTPLIVGIGNMDFGVLLPAGIGALLTIILLAKAVTKLMERHYSVVFHAIIGIVIAATLVIIPFHSFVSSAGTGLINSACIFIGIGIALLLDRFNQKFEISES
jgi:putative membrane protein